MNSPRKRENLPNEEKQRAAAARKLAAVRHKVAVSHKKTAARHQLAKGPSASGVDALAVSGKLTAKPKAVRIQVGHPHPHG